MTEQRIKFLVEYELGEQTMAELCRRYGIARKTGYKWLARWLAQGADGVANRSRAPHHRPNQVPPEQVAAILAARDRYGWGCKKLRVILERQAPDVRWPALSTIHQILDDHGRVIPRKKRRRVPPQTQPLAHCNASNAVWCCDFKGWFRTGDGVRCDPLTISDGFSRYLLRCQGLAGCDHESTQPIFKRLFKEYGLPQAIRSDNGPPFASRAIAGLSRLSVWWITLGIRPERIEPGKPQQNGRHERMHLTLKKATADPPASTARRQQQRFDAFCDEFNQVRPHEALEMATPASVYQPSPRPYPAREPDVTYPQEWARRRVQCDGDISWKKHRIFISEVLYGQTVGLEPVDDRHWRVHFGPMFLGIFDSHRLGLLTAAQIRRKPELLPTHRRDRSSAPLQNDPCQP